MDIFSARQRYIRENHIICFKPISNWLASESIHQIAFHLCALVSISLISDFYFNLIDQFEKYLFVMELLPPTNGIGKGNVFIRVCLSVSQSVYGGREVPI